MEYIELPWWLFAPIYPLVWTHGYKMWDTSFWMARPSGLAGDEPCSIASDPQRVLLEVHSEGGNPESGNQEAEFESPLSRIETKLRSLLEIVGKVDNPSWAVSFEEVQELLIDLGLLLQNSEEKLEVGEEVQEVPWLTTSLGNVLMTNRKLKRQSDDNLLLRTLGTELLNVVHQIGIRRHQRDSLLEEDLTIDTLDEQFDDTASQDFLAARKLVRQLRKENWKLDRRNQSLWMQKEKAQESKDSLVDSILQIERSSDLFSLQERLKGPRPIRKDSPRQDPQVLSTLTTDLPVTDEHLPSRICTSSDKGMPKPSTRNRKQAQNASSQLDSLSW